MKTTDRNCLSKATSFIVRRCKIVALTRPSSTRRIPRRPITSALLLDREQSLAHHAVRWRLLLEQPSIPKTLYPPFRSISSDGNYWIHCYQPRFSLTIGFRNIVHKNRTTHRSHQPTDIPTALPTHSNPFPDQSGQSLIVIYRLLANRLRSKFLPFLALPRGGASHEVEQQPNSGFIDSDGNMPQVFYDYIWQHNILLDQH